MSEHTPGPWGVDDSGCVYSGEDRYNSVRMISPWVEDAWVGNPEALANMRLIAASPALLRAAEELIKFIDDWGWDDNGAAENNGLGREVRLDALREAAAKARSTK